MAHQTGEQEHDDGQEAEPTDQPSQDAQPEHSPVIERPAEEDPTNPQLLGEVRELRLQVERVSAWMDGSMSMLRLMGIAIAILAAFGVFQIVNLAIDSSVRNRVSGEVASQVGDLTARLDSIEAALAQANELAALAESAANRAELAARSSGSRPSTAYYFGTTGIAEAFGFATGEGKWVIVVASDDTVESARARLVDLPSAEYDPVIILVGNEFLTTLGEFGNYLQAAEALEPIQSSINPLAYILDLRGFCIEPTSTEDGYLECVTDLLTP